MALLVCIAVWFILAAMCFPGTVRVFAGRGTAHDPLKLGLFLTSLLILAFNLRWLIAPQSMTALEALRWGSVVLSLFLMAVVRYYRRAT